MDEDGILTALPGGYDGETGRLRVTAFVTARLDAGGNRLPLDEYPGFARWGDVSGQLRLALDVDTAGLQQAFDLVPDPASPRPDADLWRTLFERVLVGDGHFQDLSGTTVASFPSAAVAQLVRTTYASVAESYPTVWPPATSGPLTTLHPVGRRLLRGRHSGLASVPTAFLPSASPPPGSPPGTPGRYVDRAALAPPTSATGSVQAIDEALRFYDRPGSADPLGPRVEPPPPTRPSLEFHGFVSALADYPELLRRLGLALDFLVMGAEQIPEGTGSVRFRVVESPVDWVYQEQARPLTHYEWRGRRFLALPRNQDEDLADGSLRVESERLFRMEQIDLDGAVLKLAAAARTVVGTAEVVTQNPGSETVAPSMTPDSETLPALRGNGFTLYRERRAQHVVQAWDAAAALETGHAGGGVVELWAEDVTRGYRLDVAEAGEPDTWRSLHARAGEYSLRTDVPGVRLPLPVETPIAPDEGYLKAASTSHNAAEKTVAYLHEAVAGWDGWSLSAPRPGNRIGLRAVEPPPDPATEPPGFELPLEVVFRPARGSLPRLRFGRSYRMRARLVDMAGHSTSPDVLDPSHVTPFATFFRWEPAPGPAVVPRRPFTEGESLLRMVIRSTLGVGASAYAQLPRVAGLPGHLRDDLAYRAVNERHLAAPIGSPQLAELHGLFDASVRESSSAAERDTDFDIASRSAGTFLSPADAGMLTNGKDLPRPIPPALDENGGPVAHANLQGPGEYVLHDVDQLTLPYLPDPLASGLSFTRLPGEVGTRLLDWPTDGPWYDHKPVLLRVEEGSAPPQWEAGARLLRVFLPQAEHARVDLASFLPKDELALMGVWMLERESFRNAQEQDAASGRHWMLTPWSVLDLVHAVEKPLAPPVIHVADPAVYNSGVQRFPGETFASLTGTISVHAKSTGRVDVEATWSEPVDDLTRPTPQDHPGQAHVGDFLLEPTEDECRIGRQAYAPQPGRPATHLLRHEFGDTKHRWVDYVATATTRFREYFPPEITDRALGGDLTVHTGPAQRLNVPSSHRPHPPQVEYIVPTWTWEERTSTGANGELAGGLGAFLPTTVHRRVGGGLRVYLSRPWYSSGADELLGVVVRRQPWLTLPLDRGAGVVIAGQAGLEAEHGADLVAEQIFAAGLAQGAGQQGARPAERLLAGLGTPAARPAVDVAHGVSADAAQLTSHLAVLEGVGEADEAVLAASRGIALTGVLDAIGELLGTTGPLVTTWGADPAWAGEPTAQGPYIHQFPARTAVGTNISLPGQAEPAVVVGHTPAFDEARGLWYCDLQLNPGAAYQPFVDLALVRYQPYSVDGYHASSVVRPGFLQVLPDRTAALTWLPWSSTYAVSLRGPSGWNALGASYLYHSPAAVLVDASRQVVAQVQTRPSGADDIHWAPVGAPVRLVASGTQLGDIRWHATVPAPQPVDGSEGRLLLTEHELFETDDSQAETWLNRPAGGFGESSRKPAGRRLVFATEFTL